MGNSKKTDVACEYVSDAWSEADTVRRLLDDARDAMKTGDVDRAIECLRDSQEPASMAESRIRWAMEYLQKINQES